MMTTVGTTIAPSELAVDREVSLLRFSPDDYLGMYHLIDENRAFLARSLRWTAAWTEEFATESSKKSTIPEQIESGRTAPYRIMFNDHYVGMANLSARKDNKAELGYWMAQDVQGQGVMTRAAQRLCDFGLQEWGLDEVTLDIQPDNAASIRVATRLGARMVGLIRKSAENNVSHTYERWKVAKGE